MQSLPKNHLDAYVNIQCEHKYKNMEKAKQLSTVMAHQQVTIKQNKLKLINFL